MNKEEAIRKLMAWVDANNTGRHCMRSDIPGAVLDSVSYILNYPGEVDQAVLDRVKSHLDVRFTNSMH